MKDYRYYPKGLPDLLNYAAFASEGIMLLKDGAFCSTWLYKGVDHFSSDQQTLLILRKLINQTLNTLGNGWVLHADMVRKPVRDYCEENSNYFPDATSAFLDLRRRRQFLNGRYFESHYYFTLSYKAPLEVESKLKHHFIDGTNNSEQGWEQILKFFETKIEQIENALSKCLTLKRLTSQEMLSHIHHCITSLPQNIKLPSFPVYLDRLVTSQDFVGGLYPKIGEKHIQVIGIDGFPLESNFGVLSPLTELPISYRWSNRFIFLDPSTAAAQLKKYRRLWFQKRQGLIGLVRDIFNVQASSFDSQDAMDMTQDADFALQESESGLIRYGYYTSTFILMENSTEKLKSSSKILIKQLEKSGFSSRAESINALEAYIGSLPGHSYHNVRKPMVSVLNLTDLLPLTGIDSGSYYHPCPYYPDKSPPLFYAHTSGATPIRCNLHHHDVGHTLVIGDTGCGKSTLLGFLVSQQLRFKNAQVFFFDKGYSSFALCHALGGKHYDLANDASNLAFAPLSKLEPNELDWACGWIETLCEVQGLSVTTQQRKEINHTLFNLMNQSHQTLTDLQASIQDKSLKAALEFYTLSGAMGTLLDNDHDGLALQNLTVFEMQHLLEKNSKVVLPVLEYIFHRINRQLDVCKPSLIIIEEGHRFLTGKFGQQLEIWLRECRKLNTAVVFVTQSLSEILQSSYKHILLNSCQTKLFLPNPYALSDYNKELYHQVGLNGEQLKHIKDATPKQDYYLVSSSGNRLIDLALDKSLLCLLKTLSAEQREEIKRLVAKYGTQWVYHYYLSQKLPQVADEWLRHQTEEKSNDK